LSGKISITRRVTLLFVAASSAVLLALGFVVATAVDRHFEQQDVEHLEGKLALARDTLTTLKSPGDLTFVVQLLDASLAGDLDSEMLIVGFNGSVLFATGRIQFPLDQVFDSAKKRPLQPLVWRIGKQNYRVMTAVLPTGISPESRMVIAVATSITPHEAFMRSFLYTLWLFVASAAVLTGVLGWAAARRGLAPLRTMRQQAQVVTAQQLGNRLQVDSMPVELAELAQSFNDMLARLEDAFKRLSDFSSDIAHELRTPVTNLMTQTQVALSKNRDVEEYRDILASNADELDHMSRMISDMLLLAKAENGLVVPNRKIVHLATEARTLFDYYEAVAEEKGLQFALQGDATVSADQLMLRRALANLLSNAIRHATANSILRVHLSHDAKAVWISVENTGETIAPEHLERIFDRFFRVDRSRQHNSEGNGLGLAITKSIVLAHGGTIHASSISDTTRFTIWLPHQRNDT